MYGSQIFHGFYFDDQFLLNLQVYAIPSFQKNPLVHKRDRHLLLNMKPTYAKLVNKQPFIHQSCSGIGQISKKGEMLPYFVEITLRF